MAKKIHTLITDADQAGLAANGQLINHIISGYTTKGSSISIKSFQNRGFEKNKLRLLCDLKDTLK